VSRGAGPASPPARATGFSWRWSSWSLTRKLPVLTGAIVLLVVAISLALTYDALRRTRTEAMHERLNRLVRQLVATSEQSIAARAVTLRQVAEDSAVRMALHAARAGTSLRARSPIAHAASEALLRLRIAPDSSLPIELWTTDGRRVMHVGKDVRGDSIGALHPELRTTSGRPVTEIPSGREGTDIVQNGAFYVAGGRVVYWTIAPVLEGGRRIGFIAQQRAIGNTAQNASAVRELLGNDVALYLRNARDRLWATFTGEPTVPVAGVDSTHGDFIGERPDVGQVIVSSGHVPGTPWMITLEAPVASVLDEPRATLRRLTIISIVIACAGVAAAWATSRRITRPLVSLAAASEALARGDYSQRIAAPSGLATDDEVARLTAAFNRMAAELEATLRRLEAQVTEALAVSETLEQANQELQRLSEDAEEARDAAQLANRAKSDFLAVMSHELRTPLNAIGGYVEILQLGIYGTLSEPQRDALARIARSQQVLLSVINDVLNFAKLDAGQVQYRISDVAPDDVLADIETLVAPQLQAKKLHYYFAGCDADLLVRADADKLQQIVLNLLTNAIKFTPSGGRITLSCEEQGEFALIRVTDTGIGIGQDRLETIFDPFVQVDRALNRPHEGIGLGLSISRDLARGMGGTLTVRSIPGEGSTFTLRLRCTEKDRR
jgi:signal transduction histidine kinase